MLNDTCNHNIEYGVFFIFWKVCCCGCCFFDSITILMVTSHVLCLSWNFPFSKDWRLMGDILSASSGWLEARRIKFKTENKSSICLIIHCLLQWSLIWPPTFICLLTWLLLQSQKLFFAPFFFCLWRNQVGLLACNDSYLKVHRVSWSPASGMQ